MKHAVALATAAGALLVPAAASADYATTIGSAATSHVTQSTSAGVTTFTATAADATVAASDVTATFTAGREVVVTTGPGTGAAGSLTVDEDLTGAQALTLSTNGPIALDGELAVDELTLEAGAAITQTAPLTVDGPTTLDGFSTVTLGDADNDFGGAVNADAGGTTASLSLLHDADALALGSSSFGGPVTVAADEGLSLSGTITAAGAMELASDADAPAPPALGTGDLVIAPNTTIDAGGAWIVLESVRRQQDTIGANVTLNGVAYAPGYLYAPSDTALWGVRYSAPYFGAAPYRSLYEDDVRIPGPTITVTTPAAGATYAYGSTVATDFICTQAPAEPGTGTEIASCLNDGRASGALLNTKAPGTQTLRLRATDAAGRFREQTVTFSVGADPTPVTPATPGGGTTTTPTTPPTSLAPAPPAQVAPAKPKSKPCAKTVSVVVQRPKGAKSVTATIGGQRQKVRLTAMRAVVTVRVAGRKAGTVTVKVTFRTAAGKAIKRTKKLVYKACGS